MSAFILNPTTTSRLAQHLIQWCDRNWRYPLTQLAEAAPEVVGKSGSVEAPLLAAAMHRLNCYAVHQRYGTPEASIFIFDPQAWISACNDAQLYKFLSSWCYQCSEGDADTKPMFAILQRIKHSLADRLVQRLPEFEAAKWS